ncbi:MAG: hypothetical protein J5933_00310 [Clostridia bacterium]|nr:hypothetical protein [Clostridia bacterium]
MKRIFLPILCVILALLSSLPLLSCDEDLPDPPPETVETGDAPETQPAEIPVREPGSAITPPDNPDGISVVFIYVPEDPSCDDLFAESGSTDPVSDSVFRRWKYIGDLLGTEPEVILSDASDAESFAGTLVLSGESIPEDKKAYICAAPVSLMTSCAFRGYLSDLSGADLLTDGGQLWPECFGSGVGIGGTFFVSGPASLSLVRGISAVFVGMKAASGITDYSELVRTADRGEWTWDVFIRECASLYSDINRNSMRDTDDFYALTLNSETETEAILTGLGTELFRRNAEGWFSFVPETETLSVVFDTVRELLFSSAGCYYPEEEIIQSASYAGMFGDGLSVMKITTVGDMTGLQDIESGFKSGLLPLPKSDPSQERYYSHVSGNFIAFGLPSGTGYQPLCCSVLNAMAGFSFSRTVPACMEKATGGLYSTDARVKRMADLTADSAYADPACVYRDNLAGNCSSAVAGLLSSGSGSIGSNLKTIRTRTDICERICRKQFIDAFDTVQEEPDE